MKISAGDHVAIDVLSNGEEDQWIFDCGIRLRFKNSTAMGHCVAHRSVYMRDAALRICVLHPTTVAMRLTDLAAFQHASQVGGRLHLSGVRTRFVNALVKGGVRSLKRVAA